MLCGDTIFIAARGHRAHLPRRKECFALIREKVHRSLLKARDVYRKYYFPLPSAQEEAVQPSA